VRDEDLIRLGELAEVLENIASAWASIAAVGSSNTRMRAACA